MNKVMHKCVVCGARIPQFRIGTTCDYICRRARDGGRTRGKQMGVELRNAARRDQLVEQAERRHAADIRAVFEDDHYNQPYLAT
jgi:hypothetical protein